MVKSHKKLVGVFALLFIILVGIQVYFLYKTYKIKESQVYDDVIRKLDLYRDELKKEYGLREDTVQSYFVKFRKGEMNQKEFRYNIERLNKASISSYTHLIDSIFQKEDYKVTNRYDLISTQYLPSGQYLLTKPITIFETAGKVTKPGKIEEGTWDTSSTEDHESRNTRANTYRSKVASYYEIKNIKSIVFKDLWILIICCILILIAVLWIFIQTINNLIRQQKQVEILHTVVDNIAHEFKTPIATLKIASKTLKKEWNPETLPLIDRQISRLENLMLQLHKDETSEESSSIQPHDWSYFVQDIAFTYPEIDFEFISQVSEELPFDKNLMETIIKNLCENSVKYGASHVKVNVGSMSQHLRIEISDNGRGIEKNELTHIFEKFYRIQSNNIHNTKGLGLGLYFVKNIVTKYHGTIDVSSRLKAGTTFKISIPYEN
ncbi:two-component sensor histidine kinase [Chryseobacterium shigense]|uniref:histidine kinase n=1 Tax=Chryseobacterium shigense TaxID=297244 RepID=A0A1N7ICT1_9FLAO|nr:HAMP domain-containing sensor histidine kinase [Chryseobacterium shigense]PQA91643.1 two-component sensor histidine kinase [Chryseobacterium shigense]SIS34850.1 two-component system, OmpR family, phosphate regulon sensor histidine kinase PhoR [Chryseobacterium shigense]